MIKKISLLEIFRNAMLHDPNASRKDAFEEYFRHIKDNPSAIRTLALNQFERECASWKVEKLGKSYSLVGTQKTERRAEVSAERRESRRDERERVVQETTAAVRQVILLDLPLSNGKKARDCTGAELDREGSAWKEVATHLKPTQVLDKHLSERDVKNIFARFGGKRRSTGAELHA